MGDHDTTTRPCATVALPPADRGAGSALSFVRDEMVRTAVDAGMPAEDAEAAARNALTVFANAIDEAAEAREKLGRGYHYDPSHARAMLRGLEQACRTYAAVRWTNQEKP